MKLVQKLKGLITVVFFFSFSLAIGQSVITDKSDSLSTKELENALRFIPPRLMEKAFVDESARKNIVIEMLINKRIAEAANEVTEEENPEFYWKKVFFIQKALNELYLKDYEKTLKTPDMSKLAREKYRVNKEKYAKVPEKRGSSHILFKCMKGCSRPELRPKVEEVLNKLKLGANFDDMVDKYSDDVNSKIKNGKVGVYFVGQPRVSNRYITGLFAIGNIGEYSGIVESRFGYHIIRLDSIVKESYKTFDEMKSELVEALEKKYRKLSMTEYLKSFEISEGSEVDIESINMIFANKKIELEANKLEEEKKKKKPKRAFK